MPARPALITVMDRAVRKAAPRLRRDFGEVSALQVSRKGPSDFVSNADRATEETLVEILSQARPDWGFVLEEGEDIRGRNDNERWIIDPLDGTSNFLHSIPHFAISIGAEIHGEIRAACVYQPLTDEFFWAEKGKGAFLHNQRLRVSARRELGDALLATGIPFRGHGNFEAFDRQLQAVAPNVAGIRRFGSAALDLAWVAAGRFDGFWETDLNYWDIAAGVLIVREAGGFVTDYRGSDRKVMAGEVIAANNHLHSKLHKLLAGAQRQG
ncbi:inositol monophosphatase [Pacificimonas flava]|uniref:Inositol-1-monophosphatase n=2 Tax=Pacificimonas TaxID=1960290 RepID=A0A219B770_9SPHN|nr:MULTISPECIES: inositol monophosphatase family protein [Pacificimonas]MBZ6378741.1 inositol monophosphatase [Pacificimonas aurantium]OWV33993.1 inositol monophosphatase [Pacificimonas flava]